MKNRNENNINNYKIKIIEDKKIETFSKDKNKDAYDKIHVGHRERMRLRFEKNRELVDFSPHEVLEMFLYPFIPQKDTNPIAHELINKFGGLFQVFQATTKELLTVKNMTKKAAYAINMFLSIARYTDSHQFKSKKSFNDDRKSFFAYVCSFFHLRCDECFFMFTFDNSYKLIDQHMLASGSPNGVTLNIRELVIKALQSGAKDIVIAHNHPGSSMRPSREDFDTTINIAKALIPFEITILDHIIYCPQDKVFSFADYDYISSIYLILNTQNNINNEKLQYIFDLLNKHANNENLRRELNADQVILPDEVRANILKSKNDSQKLKDLNE